MTWNGFLFGAKEMPFWALALRTVILYVFLIFATRWMRQRQIAILAGHNYLVAAGIVSLAAVRMVTPDTSLVSGIIIILLYAAANIFISYLDVKIPRQVDRHGTILMENGTLIKENMMDARITIDNLLGQLRLKNVYNLSDVSLALVEPTGKINVVKKQKGLPLTRKQMKLPVINAGLPTVLIYDGKVQEDNLKKLGYDEQWLDNKMKEKGIAQGKDVFLAMLEGDGTFHVSI
ncbi:MAG: YetF domain-containing protein [Bacillota bacterium]